MPSQPAHERRLLDAKLNTSSGGATPVFRHALDDAFARNPSPRLVLICAPAGFGKTTAMLQYRQRVQAQGLLTGWLTLDRSDNDSSRFLSGLAAAAEAILAQGRAPPAATRISTGGTGSASEVPLPALDALAGAARPFALFLDDFEVLHEPAVLVLVRELLERLPAHGRLVIGSRTLPDLRLARLRSRGQLLEVDALQLRFSAAETAVFFAGRHQPPLASGDVAALHAKTEGWIAALWLASLALERSEDRHAFIERFSGTNRAVANYLAEEVLGSQPSRVRDFLLRTSILRNLEPALCEALVPGAGSEALLGELQASNLLLARIGLERPTWRYHSMFARFLSAQLTREASHELKALHRAASTWYESQQRPVPAIDHAVEAGDTEAALRLLARHGAQLLSQGRMRLLWRWFEQLPAVAVAPHEELQALKLWAVCFTRGPGEAAALLASGPLADSAEPRVQANVRALRPLLLAMMDRYEEAREVGHEGLSHLPSGNAFADAVLSNTMSTVFAVMGDNAGARRLLDAARHGQGQERSAFNVMFSETAEGLIDLQEGRMRQAAARFRTAVTAADDDAWGPAHGNAWAGVLYAGGLYESNDLDQAAHLLEIYLPLARDVGLPDHMATGHVLLSRIAFHRGDVDQAYRVLSDLEYLGHQRRLPRLVACAHLERARVHLLKGHYPAAREELDRADNRALWEKAEGLRLPANDVEYVQLGRMRLELHNGDAENTAHRLDAEAQRAQRAGRHRRAFKLRLLQCMALHRFAPQRVWLPLATEVFAIACNEQFVRLVLDEGMLAGALLRDFVAARRAVGVGPAPDEPAGFKAYLDELLACFAPLMPADDKPDSDAPVLLEPLTRKEIGVLRLLAEGYSNSAMAEKLFVSDSTVRTHLRNINTKLDATSRTQAVARARRLGLID